MRSRTQAALAAMGRGFLYALVGVSVAVLLVLGVGPHTGRYRTLTVLSGSMAPTIPTGSLIVVVPAALADLRSGQILTYQTPSDGRVVTHRIVELLEAGAQPVIRTKGDANPAVDPWMARLSEGPAWTLRAVVPHLGYAVVWLRQGWVRAVTVYGLPAVVAATWLWQIWRPRLAGRHHVRRAFDPRPDRLAGRCGQPIADDGAARRMPRWDA